MLTVEIAAMTTEGSITEISYVGPSGMSKTDLMQRNNSGVFFITLQWNVSSDQISNVSKMMQIINVFEKYIFLSIQTNVCANSSVIRFFVC